MNELLCKVKKSSNIMYQIVRVMTVVSVVITILSIIVGIILSISGHNLITMLEAIGVHSSKRLIALSQLTRGFRVLFMMLILAQEFIIIAIMFLGLSLFGNMRKDGIPFKIKNALHIKKISILMIFYCLIPTMSNTEGTISSDLHFGGKDILLAIMLYVLARIFEYGCELQRESDETL